MTERFEEFTTNISRAYKSMLKIKGHEMTEYGLKASNVACLFFLGKHEEGLVATELCALCMADKAAISKSLTVLKEKGYAEREEDGRKYKQKYKITDSGKQVYDKISTIIGEIVEKVGDGLTEEERNTFYRSFAVIVKNLETLCKGLENEQ